LSNIYAGSYSVTVSDLNGCTIIESISVSDAGAGIVSFINITNNACFGDTNGIATAIMTGGVAPFSYLWDISVTIQNDSTAINLGEGTYSVEVTDNNGCVSTETVNIIDSTLIVASFVSDSINCFAGNDGEIIVSANGGAGNFSYQWDANTGNQIGDTANNLLANIFYNVTITDNNNCVLVDSMILFEPTQLISQISDSSYVSCYESSDGYAIAYAYGGTGNYSYIWNDIFSTLNDTLQNISAGIYSVTFFYPCV